MADISIAKPLKSDLRGIETSLQGTCLCHLGQVKIRP